MVLQRPTARGPPPEPVGPPCTGGGGPTPQTAGVILGGESRPLARPGVSRHPGGHRDPVSTLTLHATGPVAPAEAWDRYVRPARWSGWAPQITGVVTDAEVIAQGVTGRVRGPLGVTVPFVVDEVDDASRRWRWTVQVGPARMTLLHWVTPGPDGGTTTGLRVRGPLPLTVGYAGPALVALHGLVRS